MARPFFTVLIDTYNHERFIGEAIDSVLAQNFPASEMEILVVDDGSTDGTSEVVRKFQPRVRLLRKANGGQASAFNAGIPEAHGEVVAFLDGDDWWATGKLAAVAEIFARDSAVGLVGHGTTEIYLDGRRRTEVPREVSRFRLSSTEAAKMFRTRRGFLGSSRMSCRRSVLHEIGPVPKALKFEADEYLFTLAGLFADIMILNQSLLFYRLHQDNLFQLSEENTAGLRRKYEVLAALAESLREELKVRGLADDIAHIIVECVRVEADALRLILDSGFPWETLSTELKVMRILHSDASIWQHLFSCARLVPAFVMPAGAYYRWRYRLSGSAFYRNLRKQFLPFPVPGHVDRQEKGAL